MNAGSELFSVKPCTRLKSRGENMAVATQHIPRGTVICQENWMERISFVATTEEEAAEFGETCTFDPEESAALTGGTIVSKHFTDFPSPAHLQLCSTLILKHHAQCVQWVKEKTFLTNIGAGLAKMTPERHQAAIKWLKEKEFPTTSLIFWAMRENFTQLYNMMLCNAPALELPLSDTTIGLVFSPTLALFNHDCVPNAVIKKMPGGFHLTALENIQSGEEICYSYTTEAVGLVSETKLDSMLYSRYGFHCKCPTHLNQRPLYRKNVRPPTALAVVYYKNRLLEAEMRMLERHYKAGDWNKVREVCELLASGFFPIIREEPRLAFEISYKYAMSVPNCIPSEDGDKWFTLLTYVVTNYCTNPVILARCLFLHILHLVRKFNIIAWNPATAEQEHVFGGCQGNDLIVFTTNYINLRKALTLMGPVGPAGSNLIAMESYLFTGLAAYLHIMEKSVEDSEQRLADLPAAPKKSRNESLNYTTSSCAIYLVNSLVTVADLRKAHRDADEKDTLISTLSEIDDLVLRANFREHPDQFTAEDIQRLTLNKKKTKKKKSKATKKEGKRKQQSALKAKSTNIKKHEKKKVAKMLAELNNTVLFPGSYWQIENQVPIFYPAQIEK